MTKGTILQISVKPETPREHGLPKIAAPSVKITSSGLEGDYNRYSHRQKNGNPDMAVMLIAKEILDDLNKGGWAVKPGDLG